MKINIQTKRRFFAQYLMDNINPNEISEHDILELKPLSKLSDEDAIEYFDILWNRVHENKSRSFKIEYGKDWANSLLSQRYGLIPSNLLHGIDYLRSKGYAIPFMQYSVEELISFGWVKLTT